MDTFGYESVLPSPCVLPFSVYVSRCGACVLRRMSGYSASTLVVSTRVIVSNCVRVSRGLVSVCDEAGATIYDNALLRKWVLGISLAMASFVEITGKSVLGRRGEGDLARVVCGMK